MKFNSVWQVKIPKYLSFLIILLIATGLAFSIVIKAQKRAAFIIDENRFFYWKIYENELIFFRFPSNYFTQKNNNEVVTFKDELRRGYPELSVWFDGRRIENSDKKVLFTDFDNISFNLVYSGKGVNYEPEFNLILESVKIK